jgi:hypothetical protein
MRELGAAPKGERMASAPLYGRAWKIQVLTPPDNAGTQTLLEVSSSDKETSSLRVTFEIQQMYSEFFNAYIDIYNPNLQTIQTLSQGCIVSVSAGYTVEGTPGEIFRGPLLQAIVSKPDATTVVLKLICFLGMEELTNSVVSVTTGPGASQRETVLAMAANCLKRDASTGAITTTSIPIAYLAPESDFKAQRLPRSQTIFGTPNKLFANIARANEMGSAMGPHGLMVGKMDGSKNAAPDVIYAPPLSEGQTQPSDDGSIRYCLLGTPAQTQLGVDFRVLLDSRLQFKLPALRAQLKNVVIEQASFLAAFQAKQYPSLLTQDGVYFVAGVTHIGDTRGNIWESRVCGFTSVNGLFPGVFQ